MKPLVTLRDTKTSRERFASGLIMHCNGGVVSALVEHDHSGAGIRMRLAASPETRRAGQLFNLLNAGAALTSRERFGCVPGVRASRLRRNVESRTGPRRRSPTAFPGW
jgi:hypothetical protein